MNWEVDNDEVNMYKINLFLLIITLFIEVFKYPLQIAQFSLFDRENCTTTYPVNRRIPNGLNESHICVIDKTGETAHCQVIFN